MTNKGKFGIRLPFYAVIAFALAFLGQTTLLFLLCGVVLLAEKDEWAFRQVFQAFGLCVLSGLVSSVFSVLDIFTWIPFVGFVWNRIVDIILWAVEVAVLVFVILGIVNTAKGKEANVPVFNKIANWACGIVMPKVVNPTTSTTATQETDTTASNSPYDAE